MFKNSVFSARTARAIWAAVAVLGVSAAFAEERSSSEGQKPETAVSTPDAPKKIAKNPAESLGLEFPEPEKSLEGVRFEQTARGAGYAAMAIAIPQGKLPLSWTRDEVAKVEEARFVALGEKIAVMVVLTPTTAGGFSGADAKGFAVDVYKPDGSFSERLVENSCLAVDARAERGELVVCESSVMFELEPNDPRGRWVFKMVMPQPKGPPLVFGSSFEAR